MKIGGVFYSESMESHGSGQTKRKDMARISWFVLFLDNGKFRTLALDGEGLPTSQGRTVEAEGFILHFVPDYVRYSKTVLPVLESIRRAVELEGGACLKGLDARERQVVQAILSIKKGLENDEEKAAFLGSLLTNLPNPAKLFVTHKKTLNQESINLRKKGDYSLAVGLYNNVLKMHPEDEHILFNIARVYYDQGERAACRKYLELALEREPSFREAKTFLLHLDKIGVRPAVANKRLQTRFAFQTPPACEIHAEGKVLEGDILDLSATGIKCSIFGGNGALMPGHGILILSKSDLVCSILPKEPARVVWSAGDRLGAQFTNPIDRSSADFKMLLAYSNPD